MDPGVHGYTTPAEDLPLEDSAQASRAQANRQLGCWLPYGNGPGISV